MESDYSYTVFAIKSQDVWMFTAASPGRKGVALGIFENAADAKIKCQEHYNERHDKSAKK